MNKVNNMKLLAILFLKKLYARKNIFDVWMVCSKYVISNVCHVFWTWIHRWKTGRIVKLVSFSKHDGYTTHLLTDVRLIEWTISHLRKNKWDTISFSYLRYIFIFPRGIFFCLLPLLMSQCIAKSSNAISSISHYSKHDKL